MTLLSSRIVRFVSRVRGPFLTAPPLDVATSRTVETVRGNATAFQTTVFDAAGAIHDLSGVQSLNLKVRASQQFGSAILADKTLAAEELDLTVTQETWADGTKQHAEFSFSNAEMNLDPGDNRATWWLVITAMMTGGEEVTLCAGPVIWHEDNNAPGDPPPENPGTAITLEQADARYSPTSARVVANQAARLALSLEDAVGSAVVDNNDGTVWMMDPGNDDPSDAGGWIQIGVQTFREVRVSGLVVKYDDSTPAVLESDGDMVYIKTSDGHMLFSSEEQSLFSSDGAASKPSVNWGGRLLCDINGNAVLIWGESADTLSDPDGDVFMMPKERRLFTKDGYLSIDWDECKLLAVDGAVASWQVDEFKVLADLTVTYSASVGGNLYIPNANVATPSTVITRATGDARYGAETVAWKSADLARSNTDTLAADPDLTLAVAANSVYLVEAYLPYTSSPAGTTSGLKVGLAFPAGGEIRCNVTSSVNSAMGVAGRLHNSGAEVGQNNGSAQNTHMEIRGMVQTAGTAGNVAVTWAQNNLSADSTTVRKFAYLKLRKL